MAKTLSILRLHAKHRAAERYGLTLNRHTLRDAVEAIQQGRATFIEKRTNRITLWDVQVGDTICRVAYDKTRKMVASFVPRPAETP